MRPRGRSLALEACLLCLALALRADTSAATELLRIGGTGAAIETFRVLANDVARKRPGLRVKLPPSLGSGGGIHALLDGNLDVALSGRPLKEEEKGQGLVLTEFARTPLAFAVGAENPVKALTLAEVAALYDGSRRTWADATPVRVVLRPEADVDIAILKKLSPAMSRALEAALQRPGMVVADNDQDNADDIARLPGAFGAVSVAQVRAEKRTLSLVRLDGVAPTPEALRSGQYPLEKRLYVVTRDAPSPAVRALLDHLFSAAGRRTLQGLGYVPAEAR